MVVITTTIVFISNEIFLFREFLDIFKRVIVLVVRVLFKAKYETSFSGFLSNVLIIHLLYKSLTFC